MSTLNEGTFDSIALSLFRFQAKANPVYTSFIDNLGVDIKEVSSISEIPFLPISFFKRHKIQTGSWASQAIFRSSGTTASNLSEHYIDDLDFYRAHSLSCFSDFFGDITKYHLLALLPSYIERDDSSLIAMIDFFIQQSRSEFSGFYLNDHDRLLKDIQILRQRSDRKILLWGVSFALLDLAESIEMDLNDCLIIETGGMKGRRKEITREALYEILKKSLNADLIYSEYGMTELLSQAYKMADGRFRPASSMRIIGREIDDPLNRGIIGRSCGLNVIDLANAHSVAFIETEDLGNVFEDGSFTVTGRLDNSDIRGCNLMVG